MPYFVINGKPDCPNFVHAIYVAQYLADKLPNFVFKKVEKLSMDWAVYLEQLNKENKWYITESPLIWKEINMWGGKKYLIGGLSEFWEHVYCYYGLESLIPKQELEHLASDNLKFFTENTEAGRLRALTVITVFGASNPSTCLLINELAGMQSLRKSQGMIFKLFDYYQNMDRNIYERLVENALYLNEAKTFGSHEMVFVSETKEEALTDTDIVILLADFFRQDGESEEAFLKHCSCRMSALGDALNHIAKRSVKIILASNGPVCFIGSCLLSACRPKKITNIVAITADEAFPYIRAVSAKTGIPVMNISAPVVWGFVGTNHFIDIRNIVYKATMYRPFKRSLNAPKGSTLPLGTMNSEIRRMSYLLQSSYDIGAAVNEQYRQMYARLQRPPIFSKVRAIISMITLWTATEIGEEIISLGVPSNGSFGIPKGIIFSQPVKLDSNRKWVPYGHFPLMDEVTRHEIKNCISSINPTIQQFRLFPETPAIKRFELVTEERYDAYENYLQHVDDDYGECILDWSDAESNLLL